MPRRSDISSILVIGSGPIIVGQACEFDYSGTQGIRALKDEGYRVILINSNPATIMTDPSIADVVYIEPITPEFIEQIIQKEKPCAVLPTLGGQTALNMALKLDELGILSKYNVKLIGATAKVIEKSENRAVFAEAMKRIGLKCPRNLIANSTEEAIDILLFHISNLVITNNEQEALELLQKDDDSNYSTDHQEVNNIFSSYFENLKNNNLEFFKEQASALKKKIGIDPSGLPGMPVIIRPSLTLAGTGGGIANTVKEYINTIFHGIESSPINQIQIDQSIIGWKEFEMEVIRDKEDNVIIVCSIENIDPMGVHTGDSVTVAPAITLTDKEYHLMRDASIAVLREVGVDTGGSNVQFAVNPKDGELVVIEMNPRVSRSSALASKATGFPIAKIAAKISVGYTLPELINDIVSNLPEEISGIEYRQHLLSMLPSSKAESNQKATAPEVVSYIQSELSKGFSITQLLQRVLPASFEPSIDYIVIKMPKFDFKKFDIANPILGTQMQSIGEIMSIGRSFEESINKGLNSIEEDFSNLDILNWAKLRENIAKRIPFRFVNILYALRFKIILERAIAEVNYSDFHDDYSTFLIWITECLKVALGFKSDKYQAFKIEAKKAIPENPTKTDPLPKGDFTKLSAHISKEFVKNLLAKHLKEIAEITQYDSWFIDRFYNISHQKDDLRFLGELTEVKKVVKKIHEVFFDASGNSIPTTQPDVIKKIESNSYIFDDLLSLITKNRYKNLKRLGIGDGEIRELLGVKAGPEGLHLFREVRKFAGLTPVFKGVDTCANEFETNTNYFYSTYEDKCQSIFKGNKDSKGSEANIENENNEAIALSGKKVIILGSGANRIGQGIEFDYVSVKACNALRKARIRPIMVNCNPETVSTDYDISDRLYFEPITHESVMNIIENEQKDGELLGVIIQFGGQTPLKLRKTLYLAGIPILGMKEDAITLCDDRGKFSDLCKKVNAKRPNSFFAENIFELLKLAKELSYKFIIRPSSVIGGRGMAIFSSSKEFSDYLHSTSIINDRSEFTFLKILKELDCDKLFAEKKGSLLKIFQSIRTKEAKFFETKEQVFELLDLCRHSFEYDNLNYQNQLGDEFLQEYKEKSSGPKPFSKLSKESQAAISFFIENKKSNFTIYNDDYLLHLNKEQEISFLLDGFLENSIEVDVDAIRDKRGNIFIVGITEHIEFAGVHSGDSGCSLPTRNLSQKILEEIYRLTVQFSDVLTLNGLVNIQFAVQKDEVFLIEVNPRSSRTVPFIAKAINFDIAGVATAVMLFDTLPTIEEFNNFKMKKEISVSKAGIFDRKVYIVSEMDYYAVKEAVFSFEKFVDSDIILGPEMKSTGEVMGVAKTFGMAHAKAILGTNQKIRLDLGVLISVQNSDKNETLVSVARKLLNLELKIYATQGTAEYLLSRGIECTTINKVRDKGEHVVKFINNGLIGFVINTTSEKKSIIDSFEIRRAVIRKKILYSTTFEGASSVVEAFEEVKHSKLTLWNR